MLISPMRPAAEAVMTMRPERRARMCGSTAWVSSMMPKTLTS